MNVDKTVYWTCVALATIAAMLAVYQVAFAATFTTKQTAVLESIAAKWERDSMTLLVLTPTLSDPIDPNLDACVDTVARMEWMGFARALMRAAQDLRLTIGKKPPDQIFPWPATDQRGTEALFQFNMPDPLHCGPGTTWPCPWSSMVQPYLDPAAPPAGGQ